MNHHLEHVKIVVYDPCNMHISDFKLEIESSDYDACTFILSGRKVISRSAKPTPKKCGQFVTFWKRSENGPIEPFHINDQLDFFVVNVKAGDQFGQFVFPKSILIKKGIISTETQEGKRAFRVYPTWDKPSSKQAIKTQKWQTIYFYQFVESIDLQRVKELYRVNES